MVGRAGFEPATVRFLLSPWQARVMPTVGGLLQRLRQLGVASWLGSSARLSYLPTKTNRIGLGDLCVLAFYFCVKSFIVASA
jgi:hypothetical protein